MADLYAVTNKTGTKYYGANLDKRTAQRLADDLRRKGHAGAKEGDRGAKAVPMAPDASTPLVQRDSSSPATTKVPVADVLLQSLHHAVCDLAVELGNPEPAYNELRQIYGSKVAPVMASINDYFLATRDQYERALHADAAELFDDTHGVLPGSSLDGGVAPPDLELRAKAANGAVADAAEARAKEIDAKNAAALDTFTRSTTTTKLPKIPVTPAAAAPAETPPAEADEVSDAELADLIGEPPAL